MFITQKKTGMIKFNLINNYDVYSISKFAADELYRNAFVTVLQNTEQQQTYSVQG